MYEHVMMILLLKLFAFQKEQNFARKVQVSVNRTCAQDKHRTTERVNNRELVNSFFYYNRHPDRQE